MILTRRRQQRILTEIRRALRSSDPRLVARFTMFARLTEDDEIPAVERIRPWWLPWAAPVLGRGPRRRRCARRRPGPAAGRRGRVKRRLGVIVFIPATAALLISVPFILGRGQAAVPCTGAAPAHAYAGPRAPWAAGWPVSACHPAGLSHLSPARRLSAA